MSNNTSAQLIALNGRERERERERERVTNAHITFICYLLESKDLNSMVKMSFGNLCLCVNERIENHICLQWYMLMHKFCFVRL